MEDNKSKFECIYSSYNDQGNKYCLITNSDCIQSCEYNNSCKHCLDKYKKCKECSVKWFSKYRFPEL